MSAALAMHDAGEPRQIALVSQARKALAEAKSIDEVKDIRDKAEAMRLYLKQRDESLEAQNTAAEIKLWAERKAGEMLAAMEKAKGGRTYQRSTGNSVLPVEPEPTYADLGIDKMAASRFQAIASVPEDRFEQHIEDAKAEGKPLTTNGVLTLAREIREAERPRPVPSEEPDEPQPEPGPGREPEPDPEPEPEFSPRVDVRSEADQLADAWVKVFHNLYMEVNSLRDLGGPRAIAEHWGPVHCRRAINSLTRVKDALEAYIAEFKGLIS